MRDKGTLFEGLTSERICVLLTFTGKRCHPVKGPFCFSNGSVRPCITSASGYCSTRLCQGCPLSRHVEGCVKKVGSKRFRTTYSGSFGGTRLLYAIGSAPNVGCGRIVLRGPMENHCTHFYSSTRKCTRITRVRFCGKRRRVIPVSD